MTRHFWRVAAVLVVLVGSGVLSGCGTDPRLKALQADPMATATFPHTRLLRESTEKTHTALGMPVHAQVLRAFTYSGVDPKALVDQAATLAAENGWKQESRRDHGYVGSKGLADGAHLTITAGGVRDPWAFTIVLTADQANQ